ncbi:hypothetical protein F5879DRAFT_807146 [Lentinula edodes]|nr:hypothetical protein F5879DRAFT_807146 [Lentinula edodes]
MGIICSCALPELFAPLSSINCDADYYRSLCVGTLREIGDDHYPVPAATAFPSHAGKDSSVTFKSLPGSPLLVDFGLADSGAKVLPALTSATEELGSLSYMAGLLSVLRGYDKTQMHINPPHVVLEQQLSVSNCWKFSGSQGHIAVALSDTILWTDFTIHFPDPLEITERLEQAPKVFVMRALIELKNIVVQDRNLLTDWEKFVTILPLLDLSTFNSSVVFVEVARVLYDPLDGGHQLFSTYQSVQTSVILVEVLDNWGAPSTCLHRLSFHGRKIFL